MQLSARSRASNGGVPGEWGVRAATDSTVVEQELNKPGDMGLILLVGVTGGTGGSVVNGLLASGVERSKLRVLTRSPDGAAARNLVAMGVQAIAGDLDDPNSLTEAMKGSPIDNMAIFLNFKWNSHVDKLGISNLVWNTRVNIT